MIVTSSLDSIDLVLGANVTTNQLHINTSYNRVSSTAITPVKNVTVTNNTTAVNIVPAPSSGNQHQLRYCNIFNADSAKATVTVRTNYNSTTRTAISTTLQVNEYLQYTHRTGWKVFDINGALKNINGDTFINNPTIPEYNHTGGVATAASIATGTSVCYYIGKATGNHKNINIPILHINPAAVSITWAEAAIYKGTPTLGTAPTLTRCGFVDISAIFGITVATATARGIYIPVTNISAGDDLWFVIGNQASTTISTRVNTNADDIGAGFVLTVSSRPSLNSTLSPTLSTTIQPPRITWQGD